MQKLKSNQQLKILDLSRNKIQTLPQEMFYYLPNLKKIVLDYNLLVLLPSFDERHGQDEQNRVGRQLS